MFVSFFYDGYGDHLDLHVLTHSFPTRRSSDLPAKGSMGKGWYHCKDCRKKFTVRVGTLYERSHVKLHKWLMATHLLCSSKKGMSAHQLHRMLGVTYKTAWFMAHRIREAMRPEIGRAHV